MGPWVVVHPSAPSTQFLGLSHKDGELAIEELFREVAYEHLVKG